MIKCYVVLIVYSYYHRNTTRVFVQIADDLYAVISDTAAEVCHKLFPVYGDSVTNQVSRWSQEFLNIYDYI